MINMKIRIDIEDKEEKIKYAQKVLYELNIPFRTFNKNLHFKIDHPDKKADFYPTTGKFIFGPKDNGYGLLNLLHLLGYKVEPDI